MTRAGRGFTLPEVLVTIAVIAILALVVMPNLLSLIAKARVEGVASELRTDLQYAKAEAIRLRRDVTVAVASGGGSYTLSYVDDAGVTQVAKSVSLPSNTTLSASGMIVFERLRGQATSTGEVTVTNPSAGGSLKVSVNAVGTPTTCAVSGSFYGVTTSCPTVSPSA
ncbi:GspH/FimT family pseudopilin [Inhella gelatinilytica]|uniref:Type II secretion system protein H n=1 Tax=Inhella gelatinilytica TaxID=2795030 RepID=A0A931IWX8_9BURK|nr:GspH/FimT family pseudopilin [Inhella gelatinilytica]MBH9554347.1 GspH/FimT family pseudopilin [Inhella gelatinilytica]